MSTHDQNGMSALPATTLFETKLLGLIENYDVIGIDEGQFFPDLVQFCEHAANVLGKIVIVSGLDATCVRTPFGQLCELIAMAEKVDKLAAVCKLCGNDAHFTKRVVENTEEIADNSDFNESLIGGAESYISTCRACYDVSKSSCESPISPVSVAGLVRIGLSA